MDSHERKRVIWCGAGPSGKLYIELKNRGNVKLSLSSKRRPLNNLRAVRGIVVEFEGENSTAYIQKVRKFATQVLDHGIRVALVINNVTSRRTEFDRAADYFRTERWNDQIRIFQERQITKFSNQIEPWADMAEWLTRGYDPGPGQNSDLDIPDIELPDPEVDRILLARAFHDYEEIKLRALGGGKSGSVVYYVTPRLPTKRLRSLPFLAKVGPKAKIREELENYKNHVATHVPFDHRPNCDGARTAIGRERGILVQDFVENSDTLSKLIKRSGTARLVTSLFDGPLRGWRNAAQRKTKALFYSFPNLPSLENKPVLAASAEYAQTIYGCKYDVSRLFCLLKNLAQIDHQESTAHFDLHSENIFVTSHARTLVLIDFGLTGGGPLVADPACLEVDLAFKIASDCAYKDRSELYAYPLQSPSRWSMQIKYRWLRKAIRIIRERGCDSEPSRDAYVFAVIRYLLRFAAYDDQGTEESRGQAYFFAATLAETLKATMDGRHV